MRRVLVLSQVALSLMLLSGALLFGRSLRNLLILDSGFQQDGILVVNLDLGRLPLPGDQRRLIYSDIEHRLRSSSLLQASAEVLIVPISGSGWNENILTADSKSASRTESISNFNRVGPGYFATMRIPLVAGRDFDDRDQANTAKVVVVDEKFVQKFFPSANPIGRVFTVESAPGSQPPKYEIVGVVQNAKYNSLRDDFSPTVSTASAQDHPRLSTSFVIRSAQPASVVIAELKRVLDEVHPDIAVEFQLFSDNVRNSLMQERLMATLTGVFGFLAAMLATVGLYGLLSYTVSQRRNELGIRMALGASRSSLTILVMREAGLLILAGLIIGLGLTLLTSRAAASLLYGLSSRDPLTLLIAVAMLCAVALLAAYLPARRASRLEPASVLREE